MTPVYGRCCEHPEDMHLHYRAGTDCSAEGCRCRRFRPVRYFVRPGGRLWSLGFLAGLARQIR